MLTPFGKALRVFRLNEKELLKDMAAKLDVTAAYLSAVENGKKTPTKELMTRLYEHYDFTQKQKEELEEAKAKTLKSVSLEFQDDDDEELGLLFARSFNDLTDTQRFKIKQILDRKQ